MAGLHLFAFCHQVIKIALALEDRRINGFVIDDGVAAPAIALGHLGAKAVAVGPGHGGHTGAIQVDAGDRGLVKGIGLALNAILVELVDGIESQRGSARKGLAAIEGIQFLLGIVVLKYRSRLRGS